MIDWINEFVFGIFGRDPMVQPFSIYHGSGSNSRFLTWIINLFLILWPIAVPVIFWGSWRLLSRWSSGEPRFYFTMTIVMTYVSLMWFV